ncbi:hypothetical protein [Paraburkholderia sp. RL17-347-BIC-D]|uniref:hypothetical protein n=1 Tax=Paraburkholderia sp. RL17-347-BIC-D TaxID=3031632 RepID=UPI0038BDA3DC
MNLDIENAILSAHPLIFRKLESRLPSGECFERGDGWRGLIADLSHALEQIGVIVLFVHFLAVCTRKRFQINQLKIRQAAESCEAAQRCHSGFLRRYRQKMHEKGRIPHLARALKAERFDHARATLLLCLSKNSP